MLRRRFDTLRVPAGLVIYVVLGPGAAHPGSWSPPRPEPSPWLSAARSPITPPVAQGDEARKAAELAGRPLTDADIDRYCTVRTDITKLGQPKNTAAEIQKWAAESRAIRARHGITDSEYNVLLGRIMAAQTHLRFAGRMPVPADKKADVDMVGKHLVKIRLAEGKAK